MTPPECPGSGLRSPGPRVGGLRGVAWKHIVAIGLLVEEDAGVVNKAAWGLPEPPPEFGGGLMLGAGLAESRSFNPVPGARHGKADLCSLIRRY